MTAGRALAVLFAFPPAALLVLSLCSTLPSFSVHRELALVVINLQSSGGSTVGAVSGDPSRDTVSRPPGDGSPRAPRPRAGWWQQRGRGLWSLPRDGDADDRAQHEQSPCLVGCFFKPWKRCSLSCHKSILTLKSVGLLDVVVS